MSYGRNTCRNTLHKVATIWSNFKQTRACRRIMTELTNITLSTHLFSTSTVVTFTHLKQTCLGFNSAFNELVPVHRYSCSLQTCLLEKFPFQKPQFESG